MPRKTLTALLLAAAILLAVAAAVTLLPSHSSAMVSDLGYFTLCPFAPYSTLTLLFLAGVAWLVRKHIDAQQP